MRLNEDASLKLGAAAVSTVLKIWAGPAEPILGAAVDLLRAKASDRIQQRHLDRFLDRCEEIVAQRVMTELDTNEYRGLDPDEREAAILAVRDTFAAADLTDHPEIQQRILTADLHPRLIEDYLQKWKEKVLRGAALSEPAERLYALLLKETCNYIVQIVPKLPAFTSTVLIELLRRDTQILVAINDVLERSPRRRSVVDFEADYNRAVVAKLDRTEIFGVTASGAPSQYPLSVAYISLRARENEESTTGGQPVEEIIRGKRRLLIRGDAGTGKTTLLRWLAVRCARNEFPDLKHHVPFIISLRRYATRDFPQPQQFVTAIAPEIADELPRGWVHDLLRAGRALVLVDGLDEVPGGTERTKALQWLDGLVDQFPDSTYFVTSRPAAVDEAWVARRELAVADLLNMSDQDVKEFVKRWHLAIAQVINVDPEALRQDERELLSAIEADRHLRLLAVNPLLCAMLCTLNRDRKGKLPRGRMEIYQAALDMLLGRRDLERGIRATVEITTREQIEILQRLAFWLVRQGWSFAERDRIEAQVASALDGLHTVNYPASEVTDHLIARSGVLREPIPGQIDFVHRSFQEFLAGKAAADGDEIGLVVANAHEDQWREVVLMTAAHARPKECEELLRGLLARSRSSNALSHVSYLLIRALSFARYIPEDLRSAIQEAAPPLVPPATFDDAVALAPMGQLLIELLERELPISNEYAASSVRAASLIGGPNALKLIARILADRHAINDSLLQAWPYFDIEEYARTVFPGIRSDAIVYVKETKLAYWLHHLEHTRSLALDLPTFNLQHASSPPHLDDLSVTRGPRIDLAGIEKFNTVSRLTIGLTNTIPSLGPLANLTYLKFLHINVEYPFSATLDLSPLLALPHMIRVYLGTSSPIRVLNAAKAQFTFTQSTLKIRSQTQ